MPLLPLWKKEGGKRLIDIKKLTILVSTAFGLVVLSYLSFLIIWGVENTSDGQIRREAFPLAQNRAEMGKSSGFQGMGGGISHRKPKEPQKRRTRPKVREKVKYYAQQVLVSKNPLGKGEASTRAQQLGRLLTGIDTRARGGVRAVLTSGAIFIGRLRYPGNGDRVFIEFFQRISPDSEKFTVRAQALELGDGLPGIKGTFHSNMVGRSAAILGPSLVGSLFGSLIEKEALGHGLARVAGGEAQRQANKFQHFPEYVTIEAGKEIIISFEKNLEGTHH